MNRNALIALGPEKLADALLSLRNSSSAVTKQLDIILAGLQEASDSMVSMLRKEVLALEFSNAYFDYYEAPGLAERLDELRVRIADDLQAKSSTDAIALMQEFIATHDNLLNCVDDSNGEVSGTRAYA